MRMDSRTTKRILIAATAAVAAVLITAVTMLASQRGESDSTATEASTVASAPQPPAKAPMTGEIVWHADPRAAPATVFTDEIGMDMTLQAFQGQVLVVNLWATWCAPCVEELPTLDALQGKLGGPSFQTLVISQDRGGLNVVKPFVEKAGWKNLKIYLEPQNRFARDAKLRGLPTTMIFDRNGQEIARLEGTIDWAGEEIVSRLQAMINATN